ncbi:hypothetical protein GQ55_7G249600 [Panicum hallii var. hallii]|uniref:Uncharacterized protein n=1 Tax=Panicum hallii var. hallii TaxID=1504633 RepID=A0A2T7CYW8_9POAL|nr:hypothetical protein GQ55_7G249600 [Panicum hallii var. hallii]
MALHRKRLLRSLLTKTAKTASRNQRLESAPPPPPPPVAPPRPQTAPPPPKVHLALLKASFGVEFIE